MFAHLFSRKFGILIFTQDHELDQVEVIEI